MVISTLSDDFLEMRIRSYMSIISPSLIGYKAMVEFKKLIEIDPISALCHAIFMAKRKVNFSPFPDEIAKTMGYKSCDVNAILQPKKITLLENPRDFSPEAWGWYVHGEITKPKFQVSV